MKGFAFEITKNRLHLSELRLSDPKMDGEMPGLQFMAHVR